MNSIEQAHQQHQHQRHEHFQQLQQRHSRQRSGRRGSQDQHRQRRWLMEAADDPTLLLSVAPSVPKFPTPDLKGVDRMGSLVYCPSRRKTAFVKDILVPRPCVDRKSSLSEDDDHSMDTCDSGASYRPTSNRAYWLQRTLRDAIYGRVRYGVVLRRRPRRNHVDHDDALDEIDDDTTDAEWEITRESCAVKEMDWAKIMQYQGRHAENPLNEVGALQFLMEEDEKHKSRSSSDSSSSAGSQHVLIPFDIMSDEKSLYVISPYCNGGELFDLLDEADKFSEREARYWMKQILLGLDHLQRVGLCHRDLSLENLLVHDRKSLVIDLGMCLRVPFERNDGGDGNGCRWASPPPPPQAVDDDRTGGGLDFLSSSSSTNSSGKRLLMPPSGTCGKWHYMSPEIYLNAGPFDGYAVDLWAAGVILFLMVTGFPPWDRACETDERFKYLTNGYMVQLLTQWGMGLSSELMDLLQRMLTQDPAKRLTLQGVWNHPWLSNERTQSRTSPNVSRAA